MVGSASAALAEPSHDTQDDIAAEAAAAKFRQDLRARADSDPQAAQSLADFDRLDEAEQLAFGEALTDPATFESLLSAEPAPVHKTERSHVGSQDEIDVVVTTRTEAASPTGQRDVSTTAASRRSVSWSAEQRISGVLTTRLTATLHYSVNASGVPVDAHCVTGTQTNFNGFVSINAHEQPPYVELGSAFGEIIWQASLVWQGSGVQMDKRQTIITDQSGLVTGHLHNL